MSEASGLSRRRVNTGPPPSSEPSSSSLTSHGGSAFAGGNRIAFDPRDLERDEEESKAGGKVPRLTLMEEVLLLGLKDHQASLSMWIRVSDLTFECERRATYPSGTTTSPTRYEVAYLLSSPSGGALPFTRIQTVVDSPFLSV
jgi:hypothetical protein